MRRISDQLPTEPLCWDDHDKDGHELRECIQNGLIWYVQTLLQHTNSAAARLQIPDTDTLILIGDKAWLTREVCASSASTSEALAKRADTVSRCISTARSEMASNILVDGGTLRDLLLDAVAAIDPSLKA
jgi:hypothetical protein